MTSSCLLLSRSGVIPGFLSRPSQALGIAPRGLERTPRGPLPYAPGKSSEAQRQKHPEKGILEALLEPSWAPPFQVRLPSFSPSGPSWCTYHSPSSTSPLPPPFPRPTLVFRFASLAWHQSSVDRHVKNFFFPNHTSSVSVYACWPPTPRYQG